jgi:hypothetical protein
MERPGWSEMYCNYFGVKKCFFINSLAFLNFCLDNFNYFRTVFSKIAKIITCISWYGKHFEVRRIDLFLWQSYFFLLFYYDNVSTVSHKPFHKLKWILIYSKKRFFLWQSDYWEANLFLILSPISPFHCWSSIITEMLLTFPVFLMTSVLSFTRENKRK